MENWLSKRLDKYSTNLEVPDNYLLTGDVYDKYDYELYYGNRDSDIDLKMHDKSVITVAKINEENELLKNLETYGNKEILIIPNTKHGACHGLFKQLIDAAENEKISLDVPNFGDGYVEYIKESVIDKEMKTKFYEFCMENSFK
jgi:hypothetical protein